MKHILLAVLLVFPVAATASPNDYLACVVGQAAVALHGQATKEEALEIAYDLCGETVGAPSSTEISNDQAQRMADYMTLMVERMAASN